ncbi:Anucleate primary sterigmata protein B [Penicillium subrubescens]|uniref:Anucleate primary sterigmata protein B n=1 Tax=Penicillium subrubescens TaxID=1316194 RepID=UPI0025459720|nr:Anucleate primary sterigmata protein B [Penicillium subrubescens]KAJ5886366.1 Anucleate primary sterigmata protein B [Penicillium subrubescens]
MSTKASTPLVTTPPIVIPGPPSVRIPSSAHDSGAYHSPHDLSPLDADFSASDYFMAEDARGAGPPSTSFHDAETVTDDKSGAQDSITTPPAPTTNSNTTTTTTTTQADNEEKDVHDEPPATIAQSHTEEEISLLPPLTDRDDSSLFLSSEIGEREHVNNQTLIEEHEMRRKLMDMESSFLPEPSTIDVATAGRTTGADDTYLVGVGGYDPDMTQSSTFSFIPPSESYGEIEHDHDGAGEGTENVLDAARAQQSGNDTMLDSLTSSPSAAAMLRSLQRDQQSENPAENSLLSQDERPFRSQFSIAESESQLTPPSFDIHLAAFHRTGGIGGSRRSGSRPKYLTSRQSSQRLSHSSIASNNTETTHSDATLGADFALQSGGAASEQWGGLNTGQRAHMTRTTSLGSMASGVSGYSEENSLERRTLGAPIDGGLHTLEEESSPQSARQAPAFDEASAPMTPKARPRDNIPTDIAITERVKGIQVPTAFVQRFRDDFAHTGPSPEKRPGASTPAFGRSGRTMTLKEQSSTIDRLSKENFDLKMRIHFLNEALNKRSEEGIKEMISENVELKSDKLKLQKDNQGLKRKIRDLEKQLKDQQSDKDSMVNHDPEASEDDRDSPQDEELIFLRERVETYELEIERMRSENIARESEKRRLAEMVKSLSENRTAGSDAGAREERDMWKDMLEAETAAREQAEEENRRLRDESIRLKSEIYTTTSSLKPGQRERGGSTVSYASTSEREGHRGALMSTSSSTLMVELELLKQENAELRKEVSAQTSMLTSRNREKERLYQEIEELKLGQRRDGSRSVAGDSIFDRSVSRAQMRAGSEISDGTGSRDNMDREELEARNGQLRDQVSTLKLDNQAIRDQLESYTRELEALDKAYQADVDQAEEEIANLQHERDQAIQMADERDAAFQDLRAEAQEELDTLGEELDQKILECQRMGEDLRNQDESLRVLQAEMRSASEGIIRLEEDAQNNLERYKAVQQELEETNREMESLEKSLFEANTKVQRLTVQIESSQNEIAFLREEQDGDKIRIGDLESELKTYHMSLHSEKDKTRELEQRLADERHQREVVGSKEKQEVQRIMNELNREASAAKEEARRLKKSLSTQEIETNTWRERLMDLENNLRETLGDLSGSRSSLITNIMKLQKELESTALELESVRQQLDEKESLLRNRDALLESHGLESRKLSELLERERQARRADKQSFEQALKNHQQASRTITQSNSRITDLENARNSDRKRFTSLEQQFRDQLSERNALFLTIWKRLSSICGPDWAHSNSLINGNLPSQEVIGNILFWPGFSRNLLLAVKTVESVISGFKTRIRGIEHDFTKQYQNLESSFAQRVRRLERIEEAVKNLRNGRGYSSSASEVSKLRGENRLLKAEINLLQSNTRTHSSASAAAAVMASGPRSPSLASTADAERSSLTRHNSSPGTSEKPRGLTRSSTGLPQPSHTSSSSTLTNNAGAILPRSRSGVSGWDGIEEKWIHRLHELERRLKSEREGRLLDRSGARKRLEERDAENQRLRDQLQRERVRRGGPSGTVTESSRSRGVPTSDEGPSSSEGEGITVDIEV